MPDKQMTDWLADLGQHDDYAGMFSRYEAEGAFPNGTRIRKHSSEEGDSHPDGSLGTVLGSLKVEGDAANSFSKAKGIGYLYFVEWDDSPKVAVGTVDLKIKEEAND